MGKYKEGRVAWNKDKKCPKHSKIMKCLWLSSKFKEKIKATKEKNRIPLERIVAKKCNWCKQNKSTMEFGIRKDSRTGHPYYAAYCNKCRVIRNGIYQKRNRKKVTASLYRRRKNRPWTATINSIRCRCRENKYYIRKGIKNFLTLEEVKYLWFRDKAYLMKKPSIDRIDNDGHYILANCRYLEMKDNLKRRYNAKSI